MVEYQVPVNEIVHIDLLWQTMLMSKLGLPDAKTQFLFNLVEKEVSNFLDMLRSQSTVLIPKSRIFTLSVLHWSGFFLVCGISSVMPTLEF